MNKYQIDQIILITDISELIAAAMDVLGNVHMHYDDTMINNDLFELKRSLDDSYLLCRDLIDELPNVKVIK